MWTCHLYQVTTGLIGPKVQPADFSWSIELNGTESFSVSLQKTELPNLELEYWLAPWWGGFALFWDNQPIIAGPILNIPNESLTEISFNCTGIRGVLAKRKVIGELTNWSTLSKAFIQWSGMSLGTIAKRAVQQAQLKPGGTLPISFPIADQLIANDDDHQRTYRAFNIGTIDCDSILTKLSNVIDGPDILFKPRLVQDNLLTFDMWHGTEKQPRIYQNTYPIWDTTPVRGQVSGMRLSTTGAYQTSRVFSTGAGQDEGLKMTVATNYYPLQKGFPLLETSISSSNSENINVVAAHGMSNLIANTNVLQEVEMHVRADGTNPLGTFWPGDLVQINVDGFITFGTGPQRMRLLAMSGDSSSNIMINLQSEDKFLSTDNIEEM